MTLGLIDAGEAATAVPLHLVSKASLPGWLAGRPAAEQSFVAAMGFEGAAGATLFIPGEAGLGQVVLGQGEPLLSEAERDLWCLGALPNSLPAGDYRLAEQPGAEAATLMALGWALGAYAFERYKPRKRAPARLVWPEAADRARVEREAAGIVLARNLINTAAGDLGPAELAEAAAALAREHDAVCAITVGEELLAANYPMIHAVGRAAAQEPRLVDITWNPGGRRRVTLVGKGVCFDTGGLDLKPAGGMLLMKKDMGGAANVLGLAHMIMAAKLDVRLRVLVPAVENAVSARSFHPLDVLQTRKGITVEVGNTDAEGRLILADALVEADSEKPDLLIDMSTLTGAARVALGPELPALFTRHDDLAQQLEAQSRRVADPLWRLPLWPHYRKQIDSKVATISSTGTTAFNGATTAALFLAEFVSPDTRWAHLDFSAWNFGSRPGRAEGGEAMAIRALFGAIEELAAG
ncbi:leucyl aminopeptidase family protein [Roseomonas sp. BN140053]|uniref:leucyl aminopeptidase family protein n=1 Tax=Roseomonas sp. BN140053 TaxID=3391898 RepID=UPI0039EA6A54